MVRPSIYLSGDAVVGMASSGMLHYCGRECSQDRGGHCRMKSDIQRLISS